MDERPDIPSTDPNLDALIATAKDYSAVGSLGRFQQALTDAYGSNGLLSCADAIVTLADELGRLREVLKLYREYVALLEDELGRSAVFLHVHGQHAAPDKVAKGSELRESIATVASHESERTEGDDG